MANINDFKLLNLKCDRYFDFFSKSLTNVPKLSDEDKTRFGFYFFIIEHICKIDISEIPDAINDTNFNSRFYGDTSDDYGIDAIDIDEEENCIRLFNFKFRGKFKPDQTQAINALSISSKFTNAIKHKNDKKEKSKTEDFADQIYECLQKKTIWKMKLYVVSNEAQVMDKMDIHLRNFQKEYDLEVIPFGLDDIKDTMSIGPMPISAILMLDSQSIMSFSESSLSSSKSFIIRLMLSDLIRITCNDKNLREKYNIENISPLSETNLDLSVLFDNVRGFLDKSKYNKNIKRTIEENPTKFFMFNNGLTITAEKIDAEQVNAGRKVKLSINNFQVVNGGQTLRTIHIYNSENKDQITKNLSDSEILIRIFETTSDKMLINKIAEYTNSQNAISNTDLKSLSPEQIQIEQFLKDHEIFYDRKTGDTGINDESKWKITMEKFGQILYSIQGSPENAANKKKDIFGELYDDIFLSEKFQIEHSPNFILLYLDVIKKYNELKKEKRYKPMPQKVFYILYLSVRIKFQSLDEYVHVFEEVLKNFEPESKEADSRKIIRQDFKEFLNKKLNIKQ